MGITRTPTIIQMENAECGSTALAIVLSYLGCQASLENLRIDCGVSRDGSNCLDLIKAGEKYGLSGKGFRFEIDDLHKVQTPAILHWKFNHFVVFEGKKKSKYYINDPASGRLSIDHKEMSNSFTGVVLTFETNAAFKKRRDRPSGFQLLKPTIIKCKRELVLSILVGLVLLIPLAFAPFVSKALIDEVLVKGQLQFLKPILWIGFFNLFLMTFLFWKKNLILNRFEAKVCTSSSINLLHKLLYTPISFFDQRLIGELNNRRRPEVGGK